MSVTNFKYIQNFIDEETRELAYEWVYNHDPVMPENIPVATECIYNDNTIDGKTIGWSQGFCFSDTPVTENAFAYNGKDVEIKEVPQLFWDLRDKIAETVDIPKEHSFLSIWRMFEGSKMRGHYDVGYPGHVVYKCNISVLSPEDNAMFLGKKKHEIEERSLTCFEASLYGHEVKPVKGERVNLNYGFVIPCEELGHAPDSPRMKRSLKQWKEAEKNLLSSITDFKVISTSTMPHSSTQGLSSLRSSIEG